MVISLIGGLLTVFKLEKNKHFKMEIKRQRHDYIGRKGMSKECFLYVLGEILACLHKVYLVQYVLDKLFKRINHLMNI